MIEISDKNERILCDLLTILLLISKLSSYTDIYILINKNIIIIIHNSISAIININIVFPRIFRPNTIQFDKTPDNSANNQNT